MKRGKKLLVTGTVLGLFSTLGAAKPAPAATVYCTAHAPYGTYVAYLFRTGDAQPTASTQPFTIDGGKRVSFSGVRGGYWFIRVALVSEPYLVGQTNDRRLFSYYSPPLNLGDCWVNP